MDTPDQHQSSGMALLTLSALGVVYGDIGTSPLYAVKAVFDPEYGIAPEPDNVLGLVSLILWSLMVIVTLKYVTLILRATNRGEGGIMAMIALASSSLPRTSRWHAPIVMIGLFGAALFYGDGVITPAISVLSAVEGIEIATSTLKPYVIPITLGVLTLFYIVQKHGTGRIGSLFGPIMVVWFVAIGGVGLVNIFAEPSILLAANPLIGLVFLWHHQWAGFLVLGAVVLAVTGGEALYADVGHFGTRPIRIAWFALVFPALALSYLGQGALVLHDPSTTDSPFFKQFPSWAVLPLVVLATVAAVIASQATISGTFSLTKQAIQLGYLPRLRVVYTSDRTMGQVYLPVVNWLQYAFVVMAVLGFQNSTNLGAAYGIAVTGTMLITTLLTFFVIRLRWHYSLIGSAAATVFFVLIDLAFFSSNTLKFFNGGWFPLVLGIGVYTVMLTWSRGRELVGDRTQREGLSLPALLESLFLEPPVRVEGTAMFLRGERESVPRAFINNLYHNKVVHGRNVFITVHIEEKPWVAPSERIELERLDNGCYKVALRFGFKDEPDIPMAMEGCSKWGLSFDPMTTSWFISRQTVVPTDKPGMAMWREHLFATMVKNASSTADYFHLPANSVVELGAKVEI